MISVCGVNCVECPHLGQDCTGCDVLEGRVYWAQYIGADVCPIYKCVKEKAYGNCGDCPQVPCGTWGSLKDPSWSEEEHQKSIQDRLSVLKKA
ncbi:MAG TPA: DUF3795 domain-containing protein [Negativicutes bacterium]|nr:DUF3795 domain-containing protein [Negativicutes bacterium]